MAQEEPIPTWNAAHSDQSFDLVAASGLAPRLWHLYANVWLVCLLFPVGALIQMRPGPVAGALVVVGLSLFGTLYLWLMRPHPLRHAAPGKRPLPHLRLALLVMTLLGLSFSVFYDLTFLWLLVGTSAAAGKTLPLRSAHLAITVLPLLVLAMAVVLSGGPGAVDWMHIIPLAFLVRVLGLDMTGLSRLSSTMWELQTARAALARQAVIEERLRLARDLHDLLGHTLSLIILKSELAHRLIGSVPATAETEIRDIEQVARQTLLEVREAVAGYRQPTLREELSKVPHVLAAAGVQCVVEHRVGELAPATDAVLAWAVREGVTNIIRHSRATTCRIRVMRNETCVVAEVINDGPCDLEHHTLMNRGSGLTGLRERVAAQGGRMDARPLQGPSGFRLWLELPVEHEIGGNA